MSNFLGTKVSLPLTVSCICGEHLQLNFRICKYRPGFRFCHVLGHVVGTPVDINNNLHVHVSSPVLQHTPVVGVHTSIVTMCGQCCFDLPIGKLLK